MLSKPKGFNPMRNNQDALALLTSFQVYELNKHLVYLKEDAYEFHHEVSIRYEGVWYRTADHEEFTMSPYPRNFSRRTRLTRTVCFIVAQIFKLDEKSPTFIAELETIAKQTNFAMPFDGTDIRETLPDADEPIFDHLTIAEFNKMFTANISKKMTLMDVIYQLKPKEGFFLASLNPEYIHEFGMIHLNDNDTFVYLVCINLDAYPVYLTFEYIKRIEEAENNAN
jgi:hypothetical protein